MTKAIFTYFIFILTAWAISVQKIVLVVSARKEINQKNQFQINVPNLRTATALIPPRYFKWHKLLTDFPFRGQIQS